MANSLSLTSSNNNAGIFECPNCKQTIDASSTQCRFCSAAIDPVAAEAAAEKMSKVNQACVPFLTWLGMLGSYFLALAVPFMSVRWWVKFHSIRVDDRDFNRAKTTVIVISVLGGLNLLRFIVFR
jgi:hypothetical protein